MGTLTGVLHSAVSTRRIRTIAHLTFRSPTATVVVGPCPSPCIRALSPLLPTIVNELAPWGILP